ncbi:hypothetical protein VTJ04DRAFT_5187 [Mycothermus thermophilus]|uniref:uncharacterized protein n=1 Tax=Humicola insolens TaxID=85995 RepID=UPI00374431F8
MDTEGTLWPWKPTDSPQPPLNYSNSLSVRSANQLTQVRLPQTITLANRHLLFLLTLLAYITFPTTALKIPPKLQTLYTSLLNPNNTCTFPLASDFYSSSHSDPTLVYCGDHLPDSAIIYLQGVNGQLADMDLVEGYGVEGVEDLDAVVHPYVVLGNSDEVFFPERNNNRNSDEPWATFDPRLYGVQPLSVVAVVCGDELHYAVWGDVNGPDDPKPLVGEASLALATACFGRRMNGNNGHGETDMLYIAFAGLDAVPGADGAKWDAKNWKEFETSLEELGDQLVQRIGAWDGR